MAEMEKFDTPEKYTEVSRTISRNLRRLMKRRKWNGQTTASRCGLHKMQVSRALNTDYPPSVVVLLALAKGLRVEVGELLKKHR